ncbi:MAG: hypothetical protein OSA97_12430 [Nevskia sp.]|nr:hypothetical protein [Nevskia sp.]
MNIPRLLKAAPIGAVLACCAAPAAVAAGDASLFKGTVGKHPIVLKLDVSGDEATAAYFYARFKQDITLQGSASQQSYELASDSSGDKFSLHKAGDGLSGTLTTAKGTTLPVTLSAVRDEPPDPEPGLHFESPLSDYDRIKLADLHFVAGKDESVGKRTIQRSTEPLSGISLFRVTGGYAETVLPAINRVIDRDLYQNLSYYFSCGGAEGKGSGAEIALASRFLGERLLSYSITQNLSCQEAAHPSMGWSGTTIDATTGRELALEEVWWPESGGKPVSAPQGQAARTEYYRGVFAKAVIRLFRKLYPQQMKPSSDEPCDYTDPTVWEVVSWTVSDKGLQLSPSFSEAAKVCESTDWAIVPYSVLQRDNPALFAN